MTKSSALVLTALLLLAAASAASAQTLGSIISTYYTVSPGTPPTLTAIGGTPNPDALIDVAGRLVRDDCITLLGWTSGTDATATVNGVNVTFCYGPSFVEAGGGYILLVVGFDGPAPGDPGDDVAAETTGGDSSVYAVGGHGSAFHGGTATALATGSGTGHAEAHGGTGRGGTGIGGNATADGPTSAISMAGHSDNSTGGTAIGTSAGSTLAVGGSTFDGDGGDAEVDAGTTGVAMGGPDLKQTTAGDGGNATVFTAGVVGIAIGGQAGVRNPGGDARVGTLFSPILGSATAVGGSSAEGDAGFAQASAVGNATATGGDAGVNGDGGAADAWTTLGSAAAFGGNALANGDGGRGSAYVFNANGGTAVGRGGDAAGGSGGRGTAEGISYCEARGGDGAVDGGEAIAYSNLTALYPAAFARGGDSTTNGDGGKAEARAEDAGDALAIGGDSLGTGNGGDAHVGAYEHAEGYGGHALGTDGRGGDARIDFRDCGSLYLEGGNGTGNGRGGDAIGRVPAPGTQRLVFGSSETVGGNASPTGTGRGGDAVSRSENGDATATGGDGGSTTNARGGNASAIAFEYALAIGGDTNPAGAVNSLGGNANAASTCTTPGSFTAAAYGGVGNKGGIADVAVSSPGGAAFARGGNGIDPAGISGGSEGGYASAAGVSGSSSHAVGGNAAGPGLGNGGDADAFGPGPTVIHVPNNGHLGGDTAVVNWP